MNAIPSARSMLVLAAALALATVACSDDAKTGPEGCTPGTADGCPAGQVCGQDGTCHAVQPEMITVATPEARACELLFVTNGATIVGAAWGGGVEGALRQRPPRVAVTFSRTVDQPFAADAVTLQLDGSASNVLLEQARCFDAGGVLIDGADVRFAGGS